MIELRFPSRKPPPRPHLYGIAGRRLSADAPMPELEAFREHDPRPRDRAPETAEGLPAQSPDQVLYRDRADLGPCRRLVECRWRSGGYELSVTELGRFAIDRGGRRITFDRDRDSGDDTGFIEMALGPSLNLALALQGVFCLHASAVEVGGEVLAFLGVSGAGKSTLARALPALSGGRFRCVADDALPVTLDAGTARALPRFPQLKYPPGRQPGATAAPSLPLAGIYLLDTSPRRKADEASTLAGAGGVRVEPVTGIEAVLALVRHTHSARLFSRELLRRHTDCCTALASRIPVRRLVYPRERQMLPRVLPALRAGGPKTPLPDLRRGA